MRGKTSPPYFHCVEERQAKQQSTGNTAQVFLKRLLDCSLLCSFTIHSAIVPGKTPFPCLYAQSTTGRSLFPFCSKNGGVHHQHPADENDDRHSACY